MEKLLFLAHTEADGALSKNTLEALTVAQDISKALGVGFDIGLIGADVTAAAESIGSAGAGVCYAVSGPEFAQARYASDAAAAQAICTAAGASIVLAAATSRFSRALPGVAQRLGGGIDTQVSALAVDAGAVVATRWFYRQRMSGVVTRTQRPWLLTLAPGCAPAYAGAAAPMTVQALNVELPATARRTTVLEIKSPSADRQTIRPDAALLFVAGAGWTKKQADGAAHADTAESLILDFLTKAGASLGSSKSLVDQGGEGQAVLTFLTHLHQVGQTGSTPRHPKGLATCCHGEEPHVVGWRFIGERRAVNLDANCGWAQGKADVLYVADAFAVMAKVNELLGKS